jgi:hypothetical protein
MNKRTPILSVSVLAIAFAIAVCRCVGAQAGQNEQSETAKLAPALELSEYKTAIPTEAHLKARGFGTKYRLEDRHGGEPFLKECNVKAVRARDGLEIVVAVSVSADVENAKRVLKSSMGADSIEGLPGVPSGRKLAEEVWQPQYMGGGPPRGGFRLIARDGRSWVLIRLHYPVTRKDEAGRWIEEVFPRSELLMAETFLIQTLRELTNLGYTSRSTPAQRAAAEQRAAAKAAADKAGASTPKPPSR